MTKDRTFIEVAATTVDEAITNGLEELGLRREDVDVEVLDEGKRNIFRFASRQARVKLLVKATDGAEEITPLTDAEDIVPLNGESPNLSYIQQEAEAVVQNILRLMEVQATLHTEIVDIDDEERNVVSVNIEGDDLSFLIGRKSETLNAFQYIVSLILSHQTGQWITVYLDVQNYRARRLNELKKLARRTADQVAGSGKQQMLEPMPPNERRIIHIELRKNNQVITKSVGEEPYRKICVLPRN